MDRTSIRRALALSVATSALLVTAGGAGAVSPSVETWTNHVQLPFADCASFEVIGTWDIHHRLTIFSDTSGVAIRDIERIDFQGRLTNASTGAWVADSGTRTFFDTLAPDGSFLTTYMTEVRRSTYVHGAGRADFQTGAFHGTEPGNDADIAALCDGLTG